MAIKDMKNNPIFQQKSFMKENRKDKTTLKNTKKAEVFQRSTSSEGRKCDE